MADFLVSAVLEQLTSIIIDEINQEVKLVVGVKKELQTLKSNLKEIHAVLAHVESEQLKNPDVKRWLDKLKDVAYDMEDVVDEWNTARLKLQIEVKDDHNSASKLAKRRVLSLVPSCCSCFQEIGLRHDIATKIKDLNETLNDITIQKNMFKLEAGEGKAEQPERRFTTSFFDTPEVQSREQEEKKIKDLLLSGSSQSSTIQTISLVGMGGIGKTSLARSAFHDQEVKAYFDHRTIWVCVSKPFDSTRIAKAILESLTGDAQTQSFGELETILTRIKGVIGGKKFLLVMDDVWEDGPDKWEELKSSLLDGSSESKILVTTRHMVVARKMGCTRNNICPIEKLSTEACWLIFRKLAFFDRETNECQLLERIGRQIVEKCDGLPLAAKFLGSLMQSKSSVMQWEKVLNSELWELPEIWEAQTGLASLWLSYYDLSSQVRQCFSYCAIFPEDHYIVEKKIVSMWMAQGYLGTTSTIKNAMEINGEENFQSLVGRCFFQSFDIIRWKMHDVLRDFAQYIAKEECFSMEINHSEELREPPALPTKLRHLGIKVTDKDASFPNSIFTLIKLRTLWVKYLGNRTIITEAVLVSFFDKLTTLRSLILSGCGIREIPPSISRLVHLRELDLSWNDRLKRLPENVCELYNLQTLDITYCYNTDLPESMEKLINLRYLYNDNGGSFTPKGVLRLINLRTLGQFVISSGANENNCTIRDLKILKNLQGDFSVRGLKNVGEEEVKEVQLNNMNQITDLTLAFGGGETEERKRRDEELIEALEPCANIRSLDIEGYQGTKISPNWLMSLNNLKNLSLDGINCEHLPSIWKLPELEILFLSNMRSFKRLDVGFLGKETHGEISSSSSLVAFPKLKVWHVNNMENCKEWENVKDVKNFQIMPCLRKLVLIVCPKLKALPNYIYQSRTLEEVIIVQCPLVKELYQEEQNSGRDNWASPNLIVKYPTV